MKILAIETSCDETSVALLQSDTLQNNTINYLTASQVDVHKLTGGVVPEVAAREHVQVMIPLLTQLFEQTNLKPEQLDRIAVTSGPGLFTSLMVGVETARTLAYSWHKPLFGINHIEGHIAANFIANPNIAYPAIALVVSGGHTELLYMPKPATYELIGKTRDDAAGECFDKCARILGLEYPGGPQISKYGANGNRAAFAFPRPMLDRDNFDFSFSGLKTAVLYFHRDNPAANLADACASVEQAIVDVLVKKTARAIQRYGAKTLLVGGGVAANNVLRTQLQQLNVPVLIPALEYCTDNAAMIAAACKLHDTPNEIFSVKADPNWELTPR